MRKVCTIPLLIIALATLTSYLSALEKSEVLQLRTDISYFSPNGDGIQDAMFFNPILTDDVEVVRWRLELLNAKGKSVGRLTGAGFSALIRWDGRDKKGNVLPSGDYLATLTIWGRKKQFVSTPRPVVLDNQIPTVAVSLSTNVVGSSLFNSGGLPISGQATDAFGIDRWQIQILEATGRTIFVYWSTGAVRDITWDGKDKTTSFFVPRGVYTTILQAWDLAGNGSLPASTEFRVEVSAKDVLKGAIKEIRVVETPLGLVTQLRADDLFETDENGKPSLRPSSTNRLIELALLVNAYPEIEVRLDGYSSRHRQIEKDNDISSLYAWSVYSSLVKQGHVKASRLTVRGRGRTPMYGRRSISLPVIKDGVELILEGQAGW